MDSVYVDRIDAEVEREDILIKYLNSNYTLKHQKRNSLVEFISEYFNNDALTRKVGEVFKDTKPLTKKTALITVFGSNVSSDRGVIDIALLSFGGEWFNVWDVLEKVSKSGKVLKSPDKYETIKRHIRFLSAKGIEFETSGKLGQEPLFQLLTETLYI